ncbi:MAG: MFS transporter, partial [Lysobacterales bacterium]
MTIQRKRPFGQNYAFVVAGVIFLALLAAAGVRAAPGVLILPLGQAFGWSRDTISLSAANGPTMPYRKMPTAAALMQ